MPEPTAPPQVEPLPESPAESINIRIRRARKAIGLSQVELARRVGVSQSTASNWEVEGTDLGVSHLRPLAAALGMSLEELAPALTRDGVPEHDDDRVGPYLVARVSRAVANNRLTPKQARVLLDLVIVFEQQAPAR